MKSRNLYWLETPDGFENWFVAAYTKRRAQRFHEYAEGYNLNYATAKFVCHIPVDIEIKHEKMLDDPERREYWPEIAMLQDLGFIIVHENNPRQVAKNGIVYVEGRSVEGISLSYLEDKKGVYVIKVQNTSKYKIGITTNIIRRLKDFKTGNPENLKLVFFVSSDKHYKSFEKHLHDVYKKNRIGGEWFQFSKEDIEDLEGRLAYVGCTAEFDFYNIMASSIQGRCF